MDYAQTFFTDKQKQKVKQGFCEGDFVHRLGDPFEWIDGNNTQSLDLNVYLGKPSLWMYTTLYYEYYSTPKILKNKKIKHLRKKKYYNLQKFFNKHFYFIGSKNYEKYLKCLTETNIQDYLILNPYLKKKIKVLDLGPGLGRHFSWINTFFKDSVYYGADVSLFSYLNQKAFFQTFDVKVHDIIEYEQFGLSKKSIKGSENEVWQLPTWHLNKINDSLDLIIATFMLNEVSTIGLLYLIFYATRILKKNGLFYIRDSAKLKPDRHNINYDELLIKLGFERLVHHKFINRKNFFGEPRIYQKKIDAKQIEKKRGWVQEDFYDFVKKHVSKFEITSQKFSLSKRVTKTI